MANTNAPGENYSIGVDGPRSRIRAYPVSSTTPPAEKDFCKLASDGIQLFTTGDTPLGLVVGPARTYPDGVSRMLVDCHPDAVMSVQCADTTSLNVGDSVDVSGGTGVQQVAGSPSNHDFTIIDINVERTTAGAYGRCHVIWRSKHHLDRA